MTNGTGTVINYHSRPGTRYTNLTQWPLFNTFLTPFVSHCTLHFMRTEEGKQYLVCITERTIRVNCLIGKVNYERSKAVQNNYSHASGPHYYDACWQCCVSMTFWRGSGSGSADPCLWLMDPDTDSDPDPTIFVIDLQDANKKLFPVFAGLWYPADNICIS